MANLYDISTRYANILELAENPDVPVEVFEAALQDMDGELNEKLNNIVSFIRSLEGDVTIIKNEVDRLNARKKSTENKIASLKRYTEDCLKAINKDKIKTPLFTVSLQKNPPSLGILNEELIPDAYRKVETVVSYDKKGMIAELKAGAIIDGVELKESRSLRIR